MFELRIAKSENVTSWWRKIQGSKTHDHNLYSKFHIAIKCVKKVQ